MLWRQKVAKKRRRTRWVRRGFFVIPFGPNGSCRKPRLTDGSRLMVIWGLYMHFKNISDLNSRITSCRQCPRLVEWRESIAQTKRKAFAEEMYWGRPLPGFGDPHAKLVIIGLAPAAHGANRTGRMFTGDRSGEWLYRALHKAGFGNQPHARSKNDGLKLTNAYITTIVRCAPPANKPTPEERDICMEYMIQELRLLKRAKILLLLGSFVWDGTLQVLSKIGHSVRPKPTFSHGAQSQVGPYTLVGSYHPSQQNTFTGRLTKPMFDAVFSQTKRLI